jgi:type IV pilus modification protein PilV
MKNLRHRMQGFSILEAMAALMVLNLLCLGLMAWQLQAMQAQRQALALQQAVAMAHDLWQRMQVHPGAWQWYQLELDGATPAGDCRQAACNAQQWAQADLGEWLNEWRQRLPQARARLQTTAGSDPVTDLLLAWPGVSESPSPASVPDCPASHNCWQTSWRP